MNVDLKKRCAIAKHGHNLPAGWSFQLKGMKCLMSSSLFIRVSYKVGIFVCCAHFQMLVPILTLNGHSKHTHKKRIIYKMSQNQFKYDSQTFLTVFMLSWFFFFWLLFVCFHPDTLFADSTHKCRFASHFIYYHTLTKMRNRPTMKSLDLSFTRSFDIIAHRIIRLSFIHSFILIQFCHTHRRATITVYAYHFLIA